jgi:hypothetical protein
MLVALEPDGAAGPIKVVFVAIMVEEPVLLAIMRVPVK